MAELLQETNRTGSIDAYIIPQYLQSDVSDISVNVHPAEIF